MVTAVLYGPKVMGAPTDEQDLATSQYAAVPVSVDNFNNQALRHTRVLDRRTVVVSAPFEVDKEGFGVAQAVPVAVVVS